MKNFYKPLAHFLNHVGVLLLAAVTLAACQPSDPCDPNQIPINETYYLSQEDIDKIPFNKHELDTLVYVSNNNDTAILVRQPVEKSFWNASTNRNADPACQLWDSWKHETIAYNYKGSHYLLNNINFKVSTHDGWRGERNDGLYAYFKIANKNEYKTYFGAITDQNSYIDSVSINNKIFYGFILTLIGDNKTPILYNNQQGLLKITLNNTIFIKQL